MLFGIQAYFLETPGGVAEAETREVDLLTLLQEPFAGGSQTLEPVF